MFAFIRQSRMWSDDRWQIRREEDRVYQAGPPDYAAIIGVLVMECAEGQT